jgi:hydroxymethylbilane synthase
VTRIRIGTRGSALALAQSNWVKAQMMQNQPEIEIELRVIRTTGDRLIDTPMQELGGKGVFSKEIEEALLQDEIDLAVHSMKDLPPQLPARLVIAAVPEREDARDVLVTRDRRAFADLSLGTRVGTGSLRRQAQLLHRRADLSMVPIRGNVDTRLRKLDEGQVDALVMAAAGLKRIARQERIGEYLLDDVCLSAVAQGALGIECREESPVRERLSFLDHASTRSEVAAERAVLERLGGNCYVPIAARARAAGGRLQVKGIVASADGKRLIQSEASGRSESAVDLGHRLAEELLGQGAGELLAR